MRIIMVSLLITFLSLNICAMDSSDKLQNKFREKYFLSWSSYQLPKKPQEEISKDSIQDKQVYYIATYNENNELVKFVKMLDGNIEWQDEYFYWEKKGKIKKAVIINAEGKKSEIDFTKKGKPIKN